MREVLGWFRAALFGPEMEWMPAGGGAWAPEERENVFCFSGGKAPKPPKQEKAPTLPEVAVPKPPPPPAPIPPAPTESKQEVQEAEEDERRQAARRRGMRQTLLAGETGGYSASGGEGKKSLLG